MHRAVRIHRTTKSPAGFTLIEVMIAAAVMVLVILSSLGTLSFGYRVMENARLTTLAGQVLQSEMETLRLKNWTEILTLPTPQEFDPDIALDSASYGKFKCERTIENVRSTTKKITLSVTWTSMGGAAQTRQYISYFAQDGLNDYYYRKF